MEVIAMNGNGVQLGEANVADMSQVRSWMIRNSRPEFVDGFMVEGIGVVRVVRTTDGHAIGFSRLIDGQFVTGGPNIITAKQGICPDCDAGDPTSIFTECQCS